MSYKKMKQNMKTFLFATLLMATTSVTFAQSNGARNNGGNRPSREQMIENQANNIAKQLGLDAKTSKKFLSVYKSEQNDMRELMPKRGGMPPRDGMPPRGEHPQGNPPSGKPGDMKQGEAPKGAPKGMPKMSEEDQKKMKSIKDKYNKKYSKFLTQEQIQKVYQLQRPKR